MALSFVLEWDENEKDKNVRLNVQTKNLQMFQYLLQQIRLAKFHQFGLIFSLLGQKPYNRLIHQLLITREYLLSQYQSNIYYIEYTQPKIHLPKSTQTLLISIFL